MGDVAVIAYTTLKRAAAKRKSRPKGWDSSIPVTVKKKGAKGALRKVARGQRKAGIRKVNPARKRREFLRAYGGDERVVFVASLPCAACGKAGRSENAHVASGGVGRKADASQIVPLCGRWKFSLNDREYYLGCHKQFHQHGRRALEEQWGVDLDDAARATEQAWQDFQAQHPTRRHGR